MNHKILHKEIQEFIVEKSNVAVDINKLILSGSPFDNVSPQELAQQIAGRVKARQKLPTWFAQRGIYYPPTLNLEQTSSETTAIYKSKLVSGNTLIDLTGGFGIDDYFFARHIQKVIHCELHSELSHITAHNFKVLGVHNCVTIASDGLEILKNQKNVDWIYIDPSRRHESKGKVFFLEDCLPNVPASLELFFSKSNNILIKTSPLLDIQTGINALKQVKEIHIVAVNNEVKELLWILDKAFTGDVAIKTMNIQKAANQEFSFILKDEAKQTIDFALPKTYLYEPNSAILKSGGFLSIANAFGLQKLHIHSHLYTSDEQIDFPGRRFRIVSVLPYQKKILSKAGITRANITIRNFPESVATIRKKLNIKDGSENYLFFTTDHEHKKIMIQCEKIS